MLNNNMSIEEISLKMQDEFPKYLYRYRSTKHIDDDLNGKIYLAKASSLNDPMDCLLYFNFKEISSSSKFMREIERRLRIPSKVVKQKYDIYAQRKLFSECREDIRVASFSECKDSLLMWSHYADMHKGYCIEYKIDKNQNAREKLSRLNLLPVIYSKIKPDIQSDLAKLKDSSLAKIVIYKAKEWEYEKEWRILSTKEHNFCNLMSLVNAVYIGLDCTVENEEKIKDLAYKNNIKVYKMELLYDKYAIKANKI